MTVSRPLALIAASLLTLSLPAAAQRGAGRARTPSAVAISPDGTTLAWSVGGREGSTLHLTSLADPDPAKDRIVTPGGATNCSNEDPVWSPNGAWLAFTSTCTSAQEKPGQSEIFLWSKADGSVKQLTHVVGLFKQAAWSPDGKTLAFLFVENATRRAGALDAMKPWAGVIGEDNLEIQGVYGVDVASGKGQWLVAPTPQMYVFEFTWAPSSHDIAFIGAPAPGENNWWVAKLYHASPESGCPGCRFDNKGRVSVVFDPNTTKSAMHGLQIAVPRWSPDGKHIAFLGGLMSDFGSNGGDVWVVNADGKGEPVDITPGIDGTPVYETWIGNDDVGFAEDRRGHTLLAGYNIHTKTLSDKAEDLGEVTISGGPVKSFVSVSTHGTLALIDSGFRQAPEVWAGPFGALKQVTHLNDGAKLASRTESVEWENEGFHVQGWLTYPAGYDPHRTYPLIVQVHGGPSSSVGSRWGTGGMNYADHGYFEFQPNPRGSYGQGEAFTQANRRDFGYGDLRDILKGMDMLEAKFPIDKHREGLTGWSYGGFMTMFAVTQTHRFRAAVAGAGISDWLSYYGENSIDQWMVPFFGATVYDDPAVYAKSSAINHIKNVTTPTLVIVGDRDGECPAPQSFEFWHALRAIGVKTQLVVYPNEGHGFRDPEHIRDRNERFLRWFDEQMQGAGNRE